jgi:hypothetical protein
MLASKEELKKMIFGSSVGFVKGGAGVAFNVLV